MRDAQLQIRITPAEKQAIRNFAAQQGKTITNIIRTSFGLEPSTGKKPAKNAG